MIAPGLHGHGQVARPAEGADKQRHQQRHHGLGPLHQVAGLKVCAAGHLRLLNLVGFLQQGGNEAQGDGHHHAQLVGREVKALERREQQLNAVGEHDGRGGQGQQGGAHHQEHQPQGVVHCLAQALGRHGDESQLEDRLTRTGEEQVQQEGQHQDEP